MYLLLEMLDIIWNAVMIILYVDTATSVSDRSVVVVFVSSVTCFMVVVLALCIYFWICVFSFLKELEDSRNHKQTSDIPMNAV